MGWMRRMSAMFRREQLSADLEEELEFHLAKREQLSASEGMPRAEARADARRRLGNITRLKESLREIDLFTFPETIWQDACFAARMLMKQPAFSAIAIGTFALGIGANTAIFSVIDGVLFRPLPVEDPQQLVILSWTSHQKLKFKGHSDFGDCNDENDCSFSVPFFETLPTQAHSFSSVAAFAGGMEVDLSGNGPASIATGLYVSGGYFSALGVKTVQGRPLGEEDDTPSAPPAIVLDYGYWKRAFGADPSAVGRTLRIDNTDALVVGVADPQFTGLTPGKVQDFYMPLSLADRVRGAWWGSANRLRDPSMVWVTIVARLKPQVRLPQAQIEISSIFRSAVVLGGFGNATAAPAIKLLPARAALDGESSQIAPMLNLIMIAAGFVLLIACANVAGLILARSANRQRELAVRHALGARRGRIARQLLTESVLLSGAGAALGVLAAVWGVEVIAKLISSGSDQPFPFVIRPDWRVLAFTAAVTLATGIFSGLAPAFRSARSDLTPPLRENASTLPGGAHRSHRIRFGDALVVAQVTLSILVLLGAGLLVRTLHNLQSMNPGFSTQKVLLFGINPKIAGYKDHQTVQLYNDLRRQFGVLPGVVSASYSEFALLSRSWSAGEVHLDDALPKTNVNTATLAVGPDFFSTMHIPLLGGHTFSASDFTSAEDTFAAKVAADEAANKARSASGASLSPENATHAEPQPAPMPVLINQAFARQFFPNQNPVGRHMGDPQFDNPATGPQPGFRIVGIVGDTKYRDLRREIGPTMFMPLVGNIAYFELRTAGDPDALVNAVRGVVSRADKNLPLFGVRTETQQIEQTLFQERLLSRLSSFFALLALALSCLGLYGLLSYEVARRTRELGIRMALGAQRRDVMRLVVRKAAVLLLVGIAAGVGVSLGVTRFMASMLYGVQPADPLSMTSVAVLLTLVALAACYVPARRAMRVDPMAALREQ